MKLLEQRINNICSAIIMEEGDYNISPCQLKEIRVDYIFIPECDEKYYTKDNPLYNQMINCICELGVYFGQILTYKTHEPN